MENNTICSDEILKLLEDKFVNYTQLSQFNMECAKVDGERVLVIALYKDRIWVESVTIDLTDERLQTFTSDEIATTILDKLVDIVECKRQLYILKFFKCLLIGCTKILIIFLMWQLGELYLYGIIEPRAIDDIIGLVLSYYVFKAQFQKTFHM